MECSLLSPTRFSNFLGFFGIFAELTRSQYWHLVSFCWLEIFWALIEACFKFLSHYIYFSSSYAHALKCHVAFTFSSWMNACKDFLLQQWPTMHLLCANYFYMSDSVATC